MNVPLSRRPPNVHKLFSKLDFVCGGNDSQAQQLDEDDQPLLNGDEETQFQGTVIEKQTRGWLESDDIEDFD